MLNVVTKRFLNLLNEAFMTKEIKFEIFSEPYANNLYFKIMKVAMLILVVIKFTLINYKYDTDIIENIRQLLESFSQPLYNFVFMFIISKYSYPEERFNKQVFLEKFSIALQNQPCYRSSYEITQAIKQIIFWITNFSMYKILINY